MKEKERIRTKNENFAFKLLTEYFYLFFIFWIFFINGVLVQLKLFFEKTSSLMIFLNLLEEVYKTLHLSVFIIKRNYCYNNKNAIAKFIK